MKTDHIYLVHIKEEAEVAPHHEAIEWIRVSTGLSMKRIAQLLGVTRPTLYAWQRGAAITDANRRRLLTVREILNRASRHHNTRTALMSWLDTPGTSNSDTPFQLLANQEFDRARLLAISLPSPKVVLPPEWIHRTVPARYRSRPEYISEAQPPDVDDQFPDP